MNDSFESRRIENILASISDCFFALDANYRFIYVNPQTETYVGKKREELLGQDLREIFPQIAGSVFEREFVRVAENGGKSNFVAQSTLKNRWVDISIYAQPKDLALPDGGGGLAVYFRDVTEARENRMALRQSEERLRSVSEATSTALWVWDANKDKLLYQQGLEALLGFHVDSLTEFASHIHPDESAQMQNLIAHAVENHEDYEMEFRIPQIGIERADPADISHWKWLMNKVSVKWGEQGEVLFFGVNRDISPRKAAEFALQASRQQLDLIIEETEMAVWRWHPAKDEIIYEKNTESFFGEPLRHYPDVLPLIHPDDVDFLQSIVQESISKERAINFEYRIARSKNADPTNDADWRWVENRASKVGTGPNLQFLGYIIDITRRKNEERALQLTQERLQTVAADSGFSFFVWEQEKDVITEKFMLDEFYGYSVNSFSEADLTIHPDDLSRIKSQLDIVVENGGRVDVEFRALRAGIEQADPDNAAQWRYVLCKLSRHSKAGEPVVLYGFNYDMTAQKEVEARLSSTQHRLENISSEAGIAMWAWEPERDILHSKFLLDEMFGFEVRNWQDVVPHLHPDDLAPTLEMIERSIKTQQSDEVEYRIQRFEGADLTKVEDWKTYLVKVSPQLLPDGYTLFYGFNIDISQNRIAQEYVRRSELRFRSLVQANSTAVWRASADGHILPDATNTDSYIDLSPDQYSRQGWLEAVHPDEREMVREAWEKAVETSSDFQAEYRLRGPNEYRWMRARGIPVIGNDNRVIEWIGTLDDINDAKIAAELREQIFSQEREARLAAEAASRAKDEFLAVVSHELRTPLNSILGWSNLIRTGGLPEDVVKNGLEVIERSARAQAQIVEDILDVARIVTGKLAIDFKVIDLQTISTEALESVAAIAAQKGIRMQADLVSLSVLGDATRMRQILWNLLTNAIKFTPADGDIHISLRREGDRAKIIIRDSGMGISSEFLPHMFDRFRQADSSSTRRHGGLGLGLALVRSLVESHNGTVTAKSAGENQGSTFEVDLPLCEPERSSSSSSATPTISHRLSGVNILVVDDAPDTLELVQILLQREGAKVSTAMSSEKAKATLEVDKFGLILTDLAMPDEDGYALLRWVRENETALPVVAMTAFAGTQESERSMAAGFDGFVGKPIEAEKMVKTILVALGRVVA